MNKMISLKELAAHFGVHPMPGLLDRVLQVVPRDVLVDLIARFMSRAAFRDLLEKELQAALDPSDENWWRMRVCQLCLKGVDLG